jgi:phosphatidylglycerophosphate synthase
MLGLSPNAVTLLAFLLSLVAAALYYYAPTGGRSLLLGAAATLFLSAYLDAVDGRLARATGRQTRGGDFLDHALDRFSDVALVMAIGFSGMADARVALAALAGMLLASYMGTQAQAVGVGRNYKGLAGRADRLFVLFTASILDFAALAPPFAARSFLELALYYIAVFGSLTALERFGQAWKDLSRSPPP